MRGNSLLLIFWAFLLIMIVDDLNYATTQPKYELEYRWYFNKYDGLWELTDSSYCEQDTIYTYILGGAKFKFNQTGKIILNNEQN